MFNPAQNTLPRTDVIARVLCYCEYSLHLITNFIFGNLLRLYVLSTQYSKSVCQSLCGIRTVGLGAEPGKASAFTATMRVHAVPTLHIAALRGTAGDGVLGIEAASDGDEARSGYPDLTLP